MWHTAPRRRPPPLRGARMATTVRGQIWRPGRTFNPYELLTAIETQTERFLQNSIIYVFTYNLNYL